MVLGCRHLRQQVLEPKRIGRRRFDRDPACDAQVGVDVDELAGLDVVPAGSSSIRSLAKMTAGLSASSPERTRIRPALLAGLLGPPLPRSSISRSWTSG